MTTNNHKESAMNITGYRTNEDGTETRAWWVVTAPGAVGAVGSVVCIHNAEHVCTPCVEADERILPLLAG
jgi:hypothetical protein